MRVSPSLIVFAALAVAIVAIFAAAQVLTPDAPLLVSAAFDTDAITPNADGDSDIANFAFELSEPALVTLVLTDSEGREFFIRSQTRTPAGASRLAFSGVVDGFTLPTDDESFEADIERRVIPNGVYEWSLTATAVDGGETAAASGRLTVADADVALPDLTGFTISPRVFTPNQDGIADRVAINAYLTKDATVTGYLIGPDGTQFYLTPRELENEGGTVGWQQFDYEGGVDVGADPPPDGTYTVVIEAQDAEGQRVSVRGELTIALGGKPRAGILGQGSGADVVFFTAPYDEAYFSSASALGDLIPVPEPTENLGVGLVSVPVGDMLVFMTVVENYGSSPIRTAGPPPGTVYQQTQNRAALGAIEQDGVWRVGIQCEMSEEAYPYRWAVGAFDTLTQVEDEASGNVYYYLEPGQRSVVWGAIRLTAARRTLNPQRCWMGLIHEGVGVMNQSIGARDILIADPDAEE